MTKIGWIVFFVLAGSFILAVLVGLYLNLKKDFDEITRNFGAEDRPEGNRFPHETP